MIDIEIEYGIVKFKTKVLDEDWCPALFAGIEGYNKLKIKSIDLDNHIIEIEMGE